MLVLYFSPDLDLKVLRLPLKKLADLTTLSVTHLGLKFHVEQFLCLRSRLNNIFVFVLQEVRDQYTAVVKLIDSGDKLKLDQNHVETVIPAPGKQNRRTRFSDRLRRKSAEHLNADVGRPCR